MATRKRYGCAQNIFAASFTATPCRRVPYSMQKVNLFRKNHLTKPSSTYLADNAITVVVATGQDPQTTFGSLVMLSPPEVVHAFMFSLADDIRNGADDESLGIWRVGCLTAQFKYLLIDNHQARYWMSLSLREKQVGVADLVKRTPMERGHDVMEAKALIEGSRPGGECSSIECAREWSQKVELAGSSEIPNKGYIDAVFTVWKRIMVKPELKNIVLAEDLSGTSVFDSMYKYEKVCHKAPTPDVAHWLITSVLHSVKAGHVVPREVSDRTLSGRGLPGGKGLLDLYLAKFRMAEAIIDRVRENQMEPRMMEALTSWTRGADVYRADMHTPGVSTQWTSTLSASSQKMIVFFEAAVFGCSHDTAIKQGELQSKSPKYVLDNALAAIIDPIIQEAVEEGFGRPVAADVPQEGGDGEQDPSKSRDDAGCFRIEEVQKAVGGEQAAGVGVQAGAEDKLREFVAYAHTLYERHVSLVVDSPDAGASGLAAHVQASALPKAAAAGKTIGVVYDACAAGQAGSRPHLRICPFRDTHCQRSIQGAMQGMLGGDAVEVPSSCIFFLFDGHVHGNQNKLLKWFTGPDGKWLPKSCQTMYLTTSQESEQAKRARCKGTATISQVEFLHLVTAQTLDVPEKDRLHFPGMSTLGDAIGPFDVPAGTEDFVWKVLHGDKPKLFAGGYVQCGNLPPNVSDKELKADDRKFDAKDRVRGSKIGKRQTSEIRGKHKFRIFKVERPSHS